MNEMFSASGNESSRATSSTLPLSRDAGEPICEEAGANLPMINITDLSSETSNHQEDGCLKVIQVQMTWYLEMMFFNRW